MKLVKNTRIWMSTLLVWSASTAAEPAPLQTIQTEEARQGVAVDNAHVYAIDNRVDAKYDKFTGKRVAVWKADSERPLAHLNSGIVLDGKLICANSNYGGHPMTSSVEFWDTETMAHVDSHSFGVLHGSLTWLDWHEGHWWACFAHYAGSAGVPGKGPEHTVVVKFDKAWGQVASWVLPKNVLVRLAPYSASGGTWGLDGRLYISGHDRSELYVLELPKAGSTLRYVETVAFPNEGQAIAVDRTGSGLFYGIVRKTRTIVSVPMGTVEK